MLKFKLGDMVKVIRSDYHDDYFMVGVITEIGEGFLPYRVHVPTSDRVGFWHKEDDLRLVGAAPAETGARGEVYPSAFAQAVQGDDRLAVALYEAAVLDTVANEFHQEVLALRQQLAAAQAALNTMNAILDTYTVSPIDEDKPPAYANDGVFMDGMVYGQWVLARSLREAQATGGEGAE